jgi:streptomycin 3"-adenylyltransferase
MTIDVDNEVQVQISQCINLLTNIFEQDLLGVYLYGSIIVGGLQKYSDIDIFVVIARASTHEERSKLVTNLLQISGVYLQSTKPPIELTIVVHSDINPWRYPPKFDFQYGDWLRSTFESGVVEPWSSKVMPDLAVLITQLLLANKILFGPSPEKLLDQVPYHDFLAATIECLGSLSADLHTDTRNVLLTYARIWRTLETDVISAKPDAAVWVITRLPEEHKSVLQRACAICIGEEQEYWDDMVDSIQPCADYMTKCIKQRISKIDATGIGKKSLYLAK